VDIDWHDIKQAVPAFATFALMPLTYSVAYGVIGGIGLHIAIHTLYNILDILSGTRTAEQVFAEFINSFHQHTDKVRLSNWLETSMLTHAWYAG
jgi:xanthine/uracil/vitamin C permease (AzgA family)